MCHRLAHEHYIFAEINLKHTIMWLAVIISVCLAVEVLSYLSGGEVNLSKKEEDVKPEQKSSTVSTSSTRMAA